MKLWVKLYTEINDDPKIGTLSWAHRGMWAALLALAGRIDHRDDDDNETGNLDTLENCAWMLRCTVEELEDAVAEFTKRNMVVILDDGTLCIPNYPERQSRPPSAKRAAVAERVREHRNKDVTTLQKNCNKDRIDKNRIDIANAEVRERKPSEHDVIRSHLEDFFSEITTIPKPKADTASQKKRAGTLWWGPLREIAEMVDWDKHEAESLIDAAVSKLRENRLTISDPNSILKTSRALHAGDSNVVVCHVS